AQAAALAVEAGSDLLMGATSPRQVGNMINGIKQAINNGSISMQRIDDSVRRILMMKYEMGLLHIPTT
ncbi:MAG TPA: glycoside hydrolase family 3 N-terminal domain-containing protein, partial [Ktedonobacteraceae bacterium]|nr:glycoside hydrolase family 3 N-terminal domain-containing protein [Ktedonobacteraceae bacterium]